MSCVSDFLASLPSSGTSYTAGGPGTERRHRSCTENTDLHTTSLMDIVQLGGKTETGLGKQSSAFKCPTTESDFCSKMAVTSHLTFLNPILFFLLFFGPFLSNISVEHCMKIAKDQVYTTLNFTARRVCCCRSTTSVCVYTNKNTH